MMYPESAGHSTYHDEELAPILFVGIVSLSSISSETMVYRREESAAPFHEMRWLKNLGSSTICSCDE